MTAQTPVYGLKYPADGDPIRDTAAALKANADTIEAALLRGGVAPPGAADLAALSGRVSVLEPGAWQNPASQSLANFGNGWSPLQYRLEGGGLVRIRGAVVGGTITGGQVLFTLPAGFRPAANQVLVGHGGTGFVGVYVNSTGTVTLQPAAGYSFILINGAVPLT